VVFRSVLALVLVPVLAGRVPSQLVARRQRPEHTVGQSVLANVDVDVDVDVAIVNTGIFIISRYSRRRRPLLCFLLAPFFPCPLALLPL